jgi:hypothetical protein
MENELNNQGRRRNLNIQMKVKEDKTVKIYKQFSRLN